MKLAFHSSCNIADCDPNHRLFIYHVGLRISLGLRLIITYQMTQDDTVYSYLRHAFTQYVLILCMTIDAAWGVMFLDYSSACVCVHVSGVVSDRHVVDCTYCLCSGIVLPCQTESVETELPVTQGFRHFCTEFFKSTFQECYTKWD